ncbi:hypothetical protein IAR55_001908 [Kwoniella newhampshirensis]|uniref:Uncharacterized protein n=1 Tax=Kwoniella newhampshirensis TaxID=1651941 RepID=A0AAW0Z3J8_9TREE
MTRLGLFFVTLFALFFTATVTCQASPHVPRYRAGELMEARALPQTRQLEAMSNAQRMRQGYPLRKPGQVFDARLGPRAPAPSNA